MIENNVLQICADNALNDNTVSGTLAIGETSLTITSDIITKESLIDIYTSIYGVNPITVTVSSGSVEMTFPAQTVALYVKVRCS